MTLWLILFHIHYYICNTTHTVKFLLLNTHSDTTVMLNTSGWIISLSFSNVLRNVHCLWDINSAAAKVQSLRAKIWNALLSDSHFKIYINCWRKLHLETFGCILFWIWFHVSLLLHLPGLFIVVVHLCFSFCLT